MMLNFENISGYSKGKMTISRRLLTWASTPPTLSNVTPMSISIGWMSAYEKMHCIYHKIDKVVGKTYHTSSKILSFSENCFGGILFWQIDRSEFRSFNHHSFILSLAKSLLIHAITAWAGTGIALPVCNLTETSLGSFSSTIVSTVSTHVLIFGWILV